MAKSGFSAGAQSGLSDYINPVPSGLRGRIRGQQLQQVVKLTPLSFAANMVNAGVLLAAFRETGNLVWLICWSAAILIWMGWAMKAWFLSRNKKQPGSASEKALRRAVVHAGGLSLLWTIPVILLLPEAGAEQQLLLFAVAIGMMCGGAFILATVFNAALLFVSMLAAGLCTGILIGHLNGATWLLSLLVSYTLLLIIAIRAAARTFNSRITAEITSEQQRDVIALLLNDFESQSADVLWACSLHGRFLKPSFRLVKLLGVPARKLVRASLADWIRENAQLLPDELQAENLQSLIQLESCVHEQRPFRNIIFPLIVRGQLAWVSVTARMADDHHWIGVMRDVTASQTDHRHVWELAHSDSLTGLANRLLFRRKLAEVLSNGEQSHSALLWMDLDHFKDVNDHYGHPVGDELLKMVAVRLRAHSRSGDTVARLGGDEFTVILKQISTPDQVLQVARRMLQSLLEPYQIGGATIHCGASIGIARVFRDGRDVDTLCRNADTALYQAKTSGRGRILCYQSDSRAAVTGNRDNALLLKALERNQFQVLLQPQSDISRNHIHSFELLLRWHHPQAGEIMPAQFIPLLADQGLLGEVTAWTFGQGLRWLSGQPESVSLALNITPAQLLDRNSDEVLTTALARHKISATRIQLEIDCGIFGHDRLLVHSRMTALRNLGFRLILDDFGITDSSVSHLSWFRFDRIKLDKAFLDNVPAHLDRVSVAGGVIAMAKEMGMEVIAERIEDRESLQELARAGCHHVQGYVLSPPLTTERAAQMIRYSSEAAGLLSSA